MLGRFSRNIAILFALAGTVSIIQSSALGQQPPPPGQGGNNNNNQNVGGIEIDAEGVLTQRAIVGNSGLLNQQRAQAAQATLNKDLQTPNSLRKISLTRLEREVKKLVDSGKPVPDNMLYLAGLTRITHVFYYPESKDIVIAGPAEGYFVSAENHVIGTQTGRSTLQLQDLVVALRAFAPSGDKTRVISCSIDPTQDGLLRMKDAVAYVSEQFRPGDEAAVLNLFREALGMQQITIQGVSPKTHFARVLVEADYHMKLIGIGLEQPAVPITSFIEKATPTSVAKNSLQRWFFQPNYDCVTMTEDQSAIQFTGSGVKLVGEDERVSKAGQRTVTKGLNGASKAYCSSFTRMYDKLAEISPLWGELRNLVDLSIAAAFIQKADLFAKAEWSMEVFGDEAKFPVEIFHAPSQVAPVANAVWKGQYLMTPIAGGVNIQPRVALNSDLVKQDIDGKIASVKDETEGKLQGLADGQWWWD